MKRILTLLLVLGLLAAGSVAAAEVVKDIGVDPAPVDPGFTPEEMSAEALFEGVLMDSSKLLQEFGPADASLSFSGTFSGSSWTATLSGTYAGQPVSITYSATADPGTGSGSFTSTGTYGDGTWEGSGTWSFQQIDAANLDMLWDSEAIIRWLERIFRPDKHFTVPKRWARSRLPDGSIHVVDSGSYRSTFFGIPFGGVKRQISDWIYPPGGGGIATVSVNLSDEAISLTAYADVTAGTVAGSVSLSSAVVKDPVPVEVQDEAAAKAGAGSR